MTLSFKLDDMFVEKDVYMRKVSMDELEDMLLSTVYIWFKLFFFGWRIVSASPSGVPEKYDSYVIRVMPYWWPRSVDGRFYFYKNDKRCEATEVHWNIWQQAIAEDSPYPI